MRLWAVAVAVAAAAHSVGQTASQNPQTTGAIPLPSGPPPTGQQRTVPNPVRAFESPSHPLTLSPDLAVINRRLTERPLTLDDAISVALSVSPALALAGQNLAFAEGRVHEAQSAFLPTLGITPADEYVKRLSTLGYGLQATLPIDVSHLLGAATEQAEFQEVAAKLDVNRTRNDVIFRVESTFYAALRAKALTGVADENLQNSLDRLHDAQTRYKAQAVAYIDVVRAQTDAASAQQQVIQARSSFRNAIGVLANSMGINVTTELQLSDSGAVESPTGIPPATTQPGSASAAETSALQSLALGPEFKSVLGEAIAQRPEILESDAGIAAAKKGFVIARRSELPTVSLSVGYYDIRSTTGTQINEPQAFFGVNVPIFDGGVAKAREQEAQAGVSNAISVRRVQIDSVSLDVQQSYLALVQARDEVAVANQALVAAKAGFDLARVRYQAGVSSRAGISPLLEVSDAQAALTLAEQNQVNALYDYNNARARLDHSAGRFAFVKNGPGFPSVPSPRVLGR